MAEGRAAVAAHAGHRAPTCSRPRRRSTSCRSSTRPACTARSSTRSRATSTRTAPRTPTRARPGRAAPRSSCTTACLGSRVLAERRVAGRDRAGDGHRRARRERRRAVGAQGRPHGRRRPPAHADAAPLPRDRRRCREVAAIERRHARRHRPRGLHLPAEGGQTACCSASTSRTPAHWKIEGADWDFGMDAVPRGARPHHARALDRLRALPGAGTTSASSGG